LNYNTKHTSESTPPHIAINPVRGAHKSLIEAQTGIRQAKANKEIN
jgi:hypothetical protein